MIVFLLLLSLGYFVPLLVRLVDLVLERIARKGPTTVVPNVKVIAPAVVRVELKLEDDVGIDVKNVVVQSPGSNLRIDWNDMTDMVAIITAETSPVKKVEVVQDVSSGVKDEVKKATNVFSAEVNGSPVFLHLVDDSIFIPLTGDTVLYVDIVDLQRSSTGDVLEFHIITDSLSDISVRFSSTSVEGREFEVQLVCKLSSLE